MKSSVLGNKYELLVNKLSHEGHAAIAFLQHLRQCFARDYIQGLLVHNNSNIVVIVKTGIPPAGGYCETVCHECVAYTFYDMDSR